MKTDRQPDMTAHQQKVAEEWRSAETLPAVERHLRVLLLRRWGPEIPGLGLPDIQVDFLLNRCEPPPALSGESGYVEIKNSVMVRVGSMRAILEFHDENGALLRYLSGKWKTGDEPVTPMSAAVWLLVSAEDGLQVSEKTGKATTVDLFA